MTLAIRTSSTRMKLAHEAKTMRRVVPKAGDKFLHWSGGFLTDDPKQAWSGSVEQARNCRRVFDAAAGCKMAEA
ncbi:hypothetical protein JHL21_02620 [Devosia sp. WQ 349]|uniref:hypothetical protein n=1 Tax=Devosia sp. WQ 349K1 TaxID=2800329 RepID=UPI00190726BB|nr:hypothetical protein [Devosia sp. WQ 349K1]MBK1793390.1 hypothetical protein [Devosia sp. WQ 349K1]